MAGITSVLCRDVTQAQELLVSNPRAQLIAGGTLIMRAVNAGDQSIDTIVRLEAPALREISLQGDVLTVGAQVTMSMLMAHRDSAFLAPIARLVGGPAIRNMATIGGNLFAPPPYGDVTTALLVLDAQVLTADGNSTALDKWLARDINGPRAIVTAISMRRPEQASELCVHKVSRVKPKGVPHVP